jgi:hypothetical protein
LHGLSHAGESNRGAKGENSTAIVTPFAGYAAPIYRLAAGTQAIYGRFTHLGAAYNDPAMVSHSSACPGFKK